MRLLNIFRTIRISRGFGGKAYAEIKVFCTAVQFLTRLPTPSFTGFSPAWVDRSAKYFPLVGILVGCIGAVAFIAAHSLWPAPLPALIAIAVGILVTGALHEDGFADFFDCMGGASPEARLAIMKDSRLGTYGALALIGGLALKVFALSSLPTGVAPYVLVAIHAAGRLAPLFLIALMRYAGQPAAAKVALSSNAAEPFALLFAATFALVPFIFLSNPLTILGLLAGFMAAAFIAWRAWILLGGYTGDVLGAVEQSFEIGCLLGMAAWA